MPLPPSTTTFSVALTARTASASMKRERRRLELLVEVHLLERAGVDARRAPFAASPLRSSRRMSWMPESPDSAIAPSRTSLAPV